MGTRPSPPPARPRPVPLPRPGVGLTALYDSSMSVKVKICGVTSVADAELASSHGAWAIGMIFHPESPRACDPAVAAEIGTALKRRLEVVGVFVNAPLDELVELADSASMSMLQLHGEEGPAYCQEAARRTGLKVIKAARVRDSSTVRGLQAYHTDFHMLDAYVPGLAGGTGKRFDWSLAAEHPGSPPVILSGGITPENVAEAIQTVNPFAIDTATGVEQSPGRKDPGKLSALFESVRDHTAARA
jgi:phosphoribosylanthranilate isomerase